MENKQVAQPTFSRVMIKGIPYYRTRIKDADGKRHEAHNHGINIDSIERRGVKLDLTHGIGRVLRQEAQAEEVRHLAKRNDNRDTGGKAHGHRERNELDDGTHKQKNVMPQKEETKSVDFGVGLGLTYNIAKDVFVQGRYTMGMTNVFDYKEGDGFGTPAKPKNGNAQISIGFRF